MALIIDIMVIAELDRVFTMACLMLFCDNYKTILVRLCIYLLLAIGKKTYMFHSAVSVSLSVSYLASQQPAVKTQGRVTRFLHLSPTE